MNALTLRLGLGGVTLAACLAAIAIETQGFRILTSAQQPAVRARDHPMFELPLLAANGATQSSALPAAGRLRIVEITYERCRSICAVQGSVLTQAFRALHHEVAAQRLHFVSLSVDALDCPAGVGRRVQRLSAGAAGWDGVCVRDEAALALLTKRIGVVAIQDKLRDYRHTEGIFIVAADGHVMSYQPSLKTQTLVLAIQDALQTAQAKQGAAEPLAKRAPFVERYRG